MHRQLGWVCVAGAGLFLAGGASARQEQGAEERALAALEQLDARIDRDEKAPGKPVVRVQLAGPKVTDGALAHLKAFPKLRELDLHSSRVTDAGLAHLKGLNELYWLRLSGTKVTDAGLAHLKTLRNIAWLELNGTSVTDAGLEHLKGLRRLRRLELERTKVTKEGVTTLKQTISGLKIDR